MKALRISCIMVLVIGLMLSGVSTAVAKGPPDNSPGKGPHYQGEKQGFSGNVTTVSDGNVTLVTEQGANVTIKLENEFRFKIPKVLKHWEVGNVTEFASHLEGDSLEALLGSKVAVLAYNIVETMTPGMLSGIALKFMVLPAPGEPLHAHQAGNVTEFNKGPEGNITIIDVHSVSHGFTVNDDTYYRPQGIDELDITPGIFVTVVTTGLEPDIAKAIVLHKPKPEGWPKTNP